MTIGVTYASSVSQMEEIVKKIKEYLNSSELVHPEQVMVNFTEFNSSSLDIFIYFFTKTTNWAEYLEARQTINLAIMRMVEENGLSFAFPTQTVHLTNSTNEGDEKNN